MVLVTSRQNIVPMAW